MVAQLALAVVGIACLVYGVTVLAVHSGTLFFAVWFVIGAALLAMAGLLHAGVWELVPQMVRRVVAIIAGALLTAVLIGCACSASSFGRQAQPGVDYLVVLGAQVHENGPSTVLRYRLDAALAYLEENLQTRVVVTGGQGANESRPEADVMAEYLMRRGIDGARISRDTTSTTTVENLENAKEFVDPGRDTVAVVTNDFHLFRATGIARRLGYAHVEGIAAASDAWYLPNNVLRESLGIAKDVAAGNLPLPPWAWTIGT